MNEIITAINTNQNKEIFCFDVTSLFEFSPLVRNEEELKEESYLLSSQVEQKNKINISQNKKSEINSPQVRLKEENPNQRDKEEEEIDAFFEKLFHGLRIFFIITWSFSKMYIIPPAKKLARYTSRKMWKKLST